VLIKAIAAAWKRREVITDSNAFRAFSGVGEGIAGLVIDRYDRVLVLHDYEGESTLDEASLRLIADWYLENTEVRSIYRKRFVSDRSRQVAEKESYSPVPFRGEPSAPVISIDEKGRRFLIHPFAGYSTGLFLDQRENREFMGERAAGRRVLNLFAYTGGFSVAAAKYGGSVTTVDLSAKYLDWAKENFAANDLNVDAHKFVRADALEFLERLHRRKENFDQIVIDPPSFSRNDRGKVFSIGKDYLKLWELADLCLAPGGEMFFSSNYVPWTQRWLQKTAKEFWGNRASGVPLPPPPEDFSRERRPLSAVLIKLKKGDD